MGNDLSIKRARSAISDAGTETRSDVKMVGGLTNGLEILRYLLRVGEPVGVKQIARDLSMNPSTCFRLLKTLVHEGLVEFDGDKKTYSLGFGLVVLTRQLLQRDEYIALLRPRITELVQKYNVTGALWRRVGTDRVVLVDRIDNAASVRIHMTVGQRLPIFVGALGRILAAYSGLTDQELKREFERLRWDHAPRFADYLSDIQQAQTLGYAIDRDNLITGLTSVAAPVLDDSGKALMVISMIAITAQINASIVKQLGSELVQQAREVSDFVSKVHMARSKH